MTFSNIKEKKGFTLVEILIVIMIIGILATSAVGGYTSYRRSALLSLSADDIVSQINFMRDRVVHGDYKSTRKGEIICDLKKGENGEGVVDGCEDADLSLEEESSSNCFGFKYGDAELSLFSQDFNVKKKRDDILGEWVYVGCVDNFSGEDDIDFIDLKMDEIINIDSVKKLDKDGNDLGELDTFYLRFSPPDGKIEYFVDDIGAPIDYDNVDEVVVSLKYGETSYEKEIVFDVQAETITVRDV